MKISVPTETASREQRVALAPDSVSRLIKQLKVDVAIQRGAGLRAGFRDEAYQAVGATLVDDAAAAFSGADVVAKVQPPDATEIARIESGTTLLSLLRPGHSAETTPPSRRAVAIAWRPATPAPITNTLAGEILPAAVVSIGKNLPDVDAPMRTAL